MWRRTVFLVSPSKKCIYFFPTSSLSCQSISHVVVTGSMMQVGKKGKFVRKDVIMMSLSAHFKMSPMFLKVQLRNTEKH